MRNSSLTLACSADLDKYVPSTAEILAVISLDAEPWPHDGLSCHPSLRLFDHPGMMGGKHAISELTRYTFRDCHLREHGIMKGTAYIVDLSRTGVRCCIWLDWSQLQYAIDHFQRVLDSLEDEELVILVFKNIEFFQVRYDKDPQRLRAMLGQHSSNGMGCSAQDFLRQCFKSRSTTMRRILTRVYDKSFDEDIPLHAWLRSVVFGS